MEAACTPFSFEAALLDGAAASYPEPKPGLPAVIAGLVPHATTQLASFLWTKGACLVALWLVGCPRAAEAACDVIPLQVDLAV